MIKCAGKMVKRRRLCLSVRSGGGGIRRQEGGRKSQSKNSKDKEERKEAEKLASLWHSWPSIISHGAEYASGAFIKCITALGAAPRR
jgi:hypothetical protein